LSEVADPRHAQGQRYPLSHILLFSILGMFCGAPSYRRIQRFINAHRERLNEGFGGQWKRAPAPTSIRDLLQGLDPAPLEQAFREPRQPLLARSEDTEPPPAIALDGKVLRGRFERFQDPKAAQILSAFCQSERLILGHLPVSHKTNEIPVAQPLIEERGLTGYLYTLDALHCQKKLLSSSPPRGVR
jgi:hypothetical protein